MLQYNQIGKYRNKESVIMAKVGKDIVLPSGKTYQFTSYRKEGRAYIFVITYKGHRCQIKESDFNRMDMEAFLIQAENDFTIN